MSKRLVWMPAELSTEWVNSLFDHERGRYGGSVIATLEMRFTHEAWKQKIEKMMPHDYLVEVAMRARKQ